MSGQSDQPESPTAAIKDLLLADLIEAADDGDEEAARAMHALLADMLRANSLTQLARQLLADQHQSIANGKQADASTLTRPLPHRGSKVLRNRRIINLIDGQLTMRDAWKRNPQLASRFPDLASHFEAPLKLRGRDGLYASVAAVENVSAKTVENLHQSWVRSQPKKPPIDPGG